ncbi:8647_t:CDS:10 [Funneliformis geosporum]|uniref:8647_t:CDS:1 n=1 Tax=Funneliformis geosporum TaxID=1117311 RepID=A0A9W4SBZ0_9GLOM|nr:8647_t:CDS:10 [Funneliformis geosporum]
MKFDKRLQTEIAPEWRVKYIDYKALKRCLRVVYNAKIAREKESMPSKFNTIGSNQRNNVFVEKNVDSLSTNYEKVLTANNDKSKRSSIQSRTFTVNSLSDSVHDFFHKVSSALVTSQKSNSHPPHNISSLETLMFEIEPEERLFFIALDKELEKINHFYETKEKEALKRFDLLIQQYEILMSKKDEKQKNFHAEAWNTSKSIVKQSLEYFTPEMDPRSSTSEEQLIDYKTAKKRIKNAVFEFYRGVELLKNYTNLNHTGFVKILKKYDKISERNGSKIYIPKVEKFRFVKSRVTSKLLKDVEEFYVKNFEDGSNAQAIRKLRIPNNRHKTYYSSVLRIGLCLGLSIPGLIYYSIEIEKEKKSFDEPDKDDADLFAARIDLKLYTAIALPMILMLLLGVNMYIWIRYRINYKFIFELNPRDNLDYRQYLELPSIAFLSMSSIMFLNYQFGSTLKPLIPQFYPIILFSFICAIVFNPFHIFYYNARRWFIISLVRLFGSGILRVEFRDFFIADELNSLAYSMTMIQLFGCVSGRNICSTDIIYTPILGSIPATFRFLQSWKRYRDTSQKTHFINMGKYLSTIVPIWLAFEYRKNDKGEQGEQGGNNLLILWVIFQIFSSLYTYFWDIKMDWNLLQRNSVNYLLRNELGYKKRWLYYYAIISNFFLRFGWIIIMATINQAHLRFKISLIVAFCEMFRRWQWNFFRVEHEHISNCEQGRAIKDIPLPFPIQTNENILAPEMVVPVNNESPLSFALIRNLFKRRAGRKNSRSSRDSRNSDPAYNWKDFEANRDTLEYMYADEIYEISDEGENTYRRENDYASRRLPPINDYQYEVDLERSFITST